MRSVNELTQDELEELRESYFDQLLSTECEEDDKDVFESYSYPEEIPMEKIKSHYAGVIFTDEDFWCNQ